MKGNFKDHLNDYFEKNSLDTKEIAQFMELQKNYKRIRGNEYQRRPWGKIAVYCASLLLVGLGSFNLYERFNIPIEQQIAFEIANNHRKDLSNKNWDAHGDTIHLVGEKLQNLGFKPQPSSQINSLNIKSGKYCSVLGKLAAQLRYVNNSNGKVYTVYQAPVPPSLLKDRFTSYAKTIDGVRVKLWTEKGLLYGVAEGEGRAIPTNSSNGGVYQRADLK